MFFDHRGTKLAINNNNISRKLPNIWKLIYKLLNNPYVKKEIIQEIRKYFEHLNDNKNISNQIFSGYS